MRKRKLEKRILMGVLAAALTVSGAGCGKSSGNPKEPAGIQEEENFNSTGYPIVKEPIELNVLIAVGPMSGDFNKMQVFKDLEAKTNIKVNFEQVPPNAWGERKNLALASQNMPDVIIGGIGGMSDSEVIKYSNQGILVPINSYIDEYAPNFKKLLTEKPDLDAVIRNQEGNIYGLPFYNEQEMERIPDNLFINKTWLDKLGLEIPTTTEEFYQVLKAFKTQDPNGNGKADEIPFTYRANQRLTGDASLFGSFGVLDNLEHLMIKDGKLLFSPTEEGYKEAIQWMNQLYIEGLIDPEVFTQDQSQYIGKGQQEEMIVGSFVIFTDENYVGVERAYNDYTVLLPLEGPNGNRLWNKYATGYDTNAFLITKNNKYPEATIRWADEFFTEEMSMRAIMGEVGVNLGYENEVYTILEAPEGSTVNEVRSKTCPAAYFFGMITSEMNDKIIYQKDTVRKLERCKAYAPFTPEEYLPVLKLSQEDLTKRASIYTDIHNYVTEMKAKWVTGELKIEDTWDEYVKTLNKMGVEEYIEMYQKAYDAYKAQ